MYKRVLLKLSGEALKDESAMQILNVDCVKKMAKMMKTTKKAINIQNKRPRSGVSMDGRFSISCPFLT